ncbi:MAG: N-acetylmuramoyl-L-alanine amidase [Myxococcota bacterium]|nr:N-acetylmuramoyl-L-alanine amidase [Myxococcota bacterium]
MRYVLALLVAVATVVPAAAQVKIVIDPGHGGADPGGVGTGMQEKIVVLDVSKRFKALLDADTADTTGGGKWTALLTRSNDVAVSLAGRSAYSNNQDADRFMSIHSNAFGDPSANGTETFSLVATGTSANLRNLVQAEMITAWGLTNRGNKTANFAVLRDTAAPAVLHELAFITNATDAAKLGSPEQRQKAAVAHLRAIQRHYNIAPYIPGTPTEPTDKEGSITARVVDALGPVAGATVTLDTGEAATSGEDGRVTFAKAAAGARSLTATAADHDARTVEVTVAAQMTTETEIELVRHDGTEPPPPPDEAGGCSTSSAGTSTLLVIGLFALLRRRRRS